MRKRLLLVVVLSFFVFAARAADTPSKDETVDLARWVRQLGARRHRDRETALAALMQQRGPKALELLRKAASSGDLETRRRAKEVLVHLERLLDSEKYLKPQTIRLEFKDVPVADALADFARRTGIRVSLGDPDKTKLAKRTVTLDTGEVSYWEALSQLCEKARLSEQPPASLRIYEEDEFEHLRWRRRMIWRHAYYPSVPVNPDIVLADSATQRPTCNAGALRIQVVPQRPLVGPPGPLTHVTLNVDVEPRFKWSRLVSVRIDHAIDARGQKMVQPALFVGEEHHPTHWDGIMVGWDGMAPAAHGNTRQGKIELRRGETISTTIKEMRGKLSAEVETPPTPLLTVSDILKAGGQTVQGVDGSSVRILEMEPNADQYRLKIEVKLPPPPPQPHLAMWGVIQQESPVGGSVTLTGPEAEQKGLALYDAQGQPFLLATGSSQEPHKPNAPFTYTLFYQPRKEQGPPARFVLSGRRTVVLDVPFVLKNVPMR